MHVTEIELDRFKSTTAAYPIEKLNLLVGDNGTGKSAILEGVRFAVRGDTSLGERPSTSIQLCGPGGGSSRVALDNGHAFKRSLVKDHQTRSVSRDLTIAGREGLKYEEADAEVATMCGRFAPSFNLGAFLGLSSDKRRNFVLDLCAKHGPGGDIDADDIVGQFQVEYLKLQLGEGTVEMGLRNSTVDDLMDELPKTERESLLKALGKVKADIAGDITDAIAAALDRSKSMTSEAKGDKERAQAASQELSARKAGLQVVADSVAELQEQLNAENANRDDLIESIGNAEGRAKSLDAEANKMAVLDVAISDYATQLDSAVSIVVPTDDELAGIQVQINGLKQERECVPTVDLDALFAATDRAFVELENAKSAVWEWDNAKIENERKREDLEHKINSVKSGDWEAAHELCGLLDAGFQKVSNTYPANTARWNDLKVIIERNARTSELDNLTASLASLESESNGADAFTPLQERLDKCSEEHEAAHVAYETAREHDSRRSELDTKIRALGFDHQSFSGVQSARSERIAGITKTLWALKTDRIEAERRHTELLAEGAAPVEELREQRDRLDTVISDIESKIADKRKFQTLEEELTKCIADAERAQVMHDTCKVLQKAINAVRESLMEQLVKPLTERIDEFLSIAFPGRKVYCELLNDRGKPAFELGWIVDDVRRVSLPAMSGGEAATFGAGLAYALVSLSDAPLKLLMLEASELDSEALSCVMAALKYFHHKVSNVFVASCHATESHFYTDWNVIIPERVLASA